MLSVLLRDSIFTCIQSIKENDNTVFEELRFLLMMNRNELNTKEVNSILDLFIYGLENSKIKNQNEWSKDNSEHFSGNCFLSDVWKRKFSNGEYTLDSLVDYVKLIKAEPTSKNLDYSLRNVEATLRDDVTYQDFKMYMDICKSVLNDILNGKAR